jgi:hypothetical protein
LAVNVTVQVVPDTPSHPFHPVKVAPFAGVAVSVTRVPEANAAEHVAPQLIPPGLDVTVPFALEATDSTGAVPTVSVVLPLRPSNVAVIVVDPEATAVASPPAVIVATDGLLLVHAALILITVVGVLASAVEPVPSSP